MIARVACAALLLVGCGDALEPRALIERPRILGARTEVDGAPERCWPAPGETATLDVLVVEPGPARPRRWSLVACPMAPARIGSPACGGEILGRQSGASPEEPSLSFTAPTPSPGESSIIAVLGAVCTEGEVLFSRDQVPIACDPSGDDATVLSAEVPVWVGGAGNENPSLADAAWFFENDALSMSSTALSPGDPCTSSDGLTAWSLDDGEASFGVSLAGDMREPLDPDDTAIGAPRETLQLSHFSTGGTFERPVTFIEADDAAFPERIELAWEPPDDVAPEGEVVRFVTVIRDGRGGADWALHDVCLLP